MPIVVAFVSLSLPSTQAGLTIINVKPRYHAKTLVTLASDDAKNQACRLDLMQEYW